jgi:hypothetical protein
VLYTNVTFIQLSSSPTRDLEVVSIQNDSDYKFSTFKFSYYPQICKNYATKETHLAEWVNN